MKLTQKRLKRTLKAKVLSNLVLQCSSFISKFYTNRMTVDTMFKHEGNILNKALKCLQIKHHLYLIL